jgi:hypothetical protein
MKRINEAVGWGVFLLLAGVFLLLKNLGVFGQWGEIAWAALYALAGLGFLVWFFAGTENWWRAIPAFTLLGVGGGMFLAGRNLAMAGYGPALALAGIALGFWAVLVVRREQWWALVPAGTLTTVAILLALWGQLDLPGRMAVLLVGTGLTWLLLYVFRYNKRDARWASVPAAALLLLGAVTLIGALALPTLVINWWPIALVLGGLALAIGGVAARKPAGPAPVLKPDSFEKLPPAPGASVTTNLPAADYKSLSARPAATPVVTGTAAEAGEVDIYELIKQQPTDLPPDAK